MRLNVSGSRPKKNCRMLVGQRRSLRGSSRVGALQQVKGRLNQLGISFHITYLRVLVWGGAAFCTKDRLLVYTWLAKLIAGVHVGRADKSRSGSPMAVS